MKRLLLSRAEELETSVESPPEAELWDGRRGCRLQSRERSRSRGRKGRNEREAVAEEWREKVELMIAEGALAINDPGEHRRILLSQLPSLLCHRRLDDTILCRFICRFPTWDILRRQSTLAQQIVEET